MAKEEKKAPKLRFNGYTNDWEQQELGAVVEFYSGLTYKPENVVQNGTLVIRSSNIHNNQYINADNVYVKNNIVNSEYVQEQDIIVVVRNGSRNLIGKHALLKSIPHDPSVIGAFMTGIRSLNNQFIEAVLNTEKFKREINKNLGATINQITTSQFKKMKFNFPKREEDKQIGILFNYLDDTIQLHERKYEELALIKKALLQKLFPKNDEVAPEVRYKNFNDAWEQRKLGEVGKTFTGLSGKTKEDFGHGDAHFVTYMNVYSNPISDPNMVENVEIDTKQQEVKKGDVFFTTSSETPEEVGMSSVWLSDAPHIYLNSFCFGFRPTVNIFHPYYLAYLLRSNNIRNKMMILAQGISRYNISKNKVMKLNVTIPNIREQQKIGEFFKQLDFLITLHHRKLEKLKQLKKFLLQNMFI